MGLCGSKNDVIENNDKNKKNQKNVKRIKHQTTSTSMVLNPGLFISLKEGSISDYYRIGDIIGEGGFGCVRIVTNKITLQKRAMKQIRKDKIPKEDEKQMFAEVDVLKSLDHPNIVKLFEFYQDNKNYYLITEFLEGGELFDNLTQCGTFTERKAADYMQQLFSAVLFCHQNNIIHRDLKLENLLLAQKKEDSIIKVIDFGTSRVLNPNEKLSRRIGTAYYMAPEVLNRNYDKKCDNWSCGVILYILLCGYPPFNGTDQEIKSKISIGKFTFDSQDWDQISDEAKQLISQLLVIDPNHRISIQDALNHPWIQSKAPSTKISNNLLKNLQTFYCSSKWQAAIQMFIVSQYQTNKENEELNKQFKAMDSNQDGTLSRDEILNAYLQVYHDRDKALQICDELFLSADSNNSGKIDFTEFLVASSNQQKLNTKKRLEKVFNLFDQDSNGQISKDELQMIMGGIDLDNNQWSDILNECDKNGDGQISLQEFVDLMQQQK